MKKIKYLLLAMMAIMSTVSFTACSSNDENIQNNWTTYQNQVNETIKNTQSKSKNSKAILLVAFGSTWQQAFDAFDSTKKVYEAAFPGYDVFVSFSSAICINRAAAGEHVADGAEVRNYYAPNFWLQGFGMLKCYKDITVQSLQVIPGEEFTRVINYMKDFANNSLGDIDDDYLATVTLRLGTPLLDTKDDVEAVAKALDKNYGNLAKQGVVAFMGHGNPDSYDTYSGNVRYTQLEESLQSINPNYFVGTVDMPDNYKTSVWVRMQGAGIVNGKVFLHPLMSIAGDHANNDMAGDDGEDMNPDEYEFNEEGEIEDLSWKWYFQKAGYTCNNETCIVKGLLEVNDVRAVWMQHTKDAIMNAPLEDFYHSKNPEVE
ncbi:MAG: sirohydrochlorin cobaltochelatase [Bacteroidales bacterium]|nr:sirohydrochlorin cobaltochelatase [Candidatus Minthousia equi]